MDENKETWGKMWIDDAPLGPISVDVNAVEFGFTRNSETDEIAFAAKDQDGKLVRINLPAGSREAIEVMVAAMRALP
jgi:hypothetical protein